MGSPNIYVNSIPAHRVTDTWEVHCAGICHNSQMAAGSPNVFFNTLSAARVGDAIGCTSTAATGSPNVFINEGNDSPIVVGGVELPRDQNEYVNAEPLLNTVVCGPMDFQTGDPIADEYETNSGGRVYPPLPQTSPPPPISKPPVEQNDTEPPHMTPTPTDCTAITLPIDYDFQLSPNFTLRDVSIGAVYRHAIVAQNGLSIQDIVCNLKALAINVIEPINSKYPGARINSGFRTRQNGRSQHEKGQAVDIQWPGISYDEYWARVNWVKDNIALDQLLFEHGNMPWIHVSFNRAGNRPANAPNKVMTMYNNQFSPGLRKMR